MFFLKLSISEGTELKSNKAPRCLKGSPAVLCVHCGLFSLPKFIVHWTSHVQSHMRMIFEIRDLKYATPATVSRAGILYISTDDGTQWISLIQSWLKQREEPQNIKDAFQVTTLQRESTHLSNQAGKLFPYLWRTLRQHWHQAC